MNRADFLLQTPVENLDARGHCQIMAAGDTSKMLSDQDREILIARVGDHYRLLHGHLRLVTKLFTGCDVSVDIKDEGTVRIVKTRGGLQVERGSQRLPLLRDE